MVMLHLVGDCSVWTDRMMMPYILHTTKLKGYKLQKVIFYLDKDLQVKNQVKILILLSKLFCDLKSIS